MDKKERMRSLYDQTSNHYDERYWDIQIHKYSAFERDLINEFSPLIIDSGGGTGLLARYVKREIIVVDISIGMLRVAEQYSHAHLVAADGEKLPFRDGATEFVVSFSMIQNLPSPCLGVSEILRCSSKAGIITSLERVFSMSQLEKCLDTSSVSYESTGISQEDIGIKFQIQSSSSSNS